MKLTANVLDDRPFATDNYYQVFYGVGDCPELASGALFSAGECKSYGNFFWVVALVLIGAFVFTSVLIQHFMVGPTTMTHSVSFLPNTSMGGDRALSVCFRGVG
jgi:hypothetical protein